MAKTVTPQTWAQALLQRLGEPVTPGNVRVIEEWEAREGGHWLNTARFNPLNTTQSEPGSSSINSVGVKAYTSWQEGLTATATTLKNGLYNNVLVALHKNDQQAAIQAIRQSPWAGAHGYTTWVDAAGGKAYAQAHVSGGAIPPRQSQPFTLPPVSLSAFSSKSGGSNIGTWVAANITLVVIVLIVILVLKRK